MSVAILMILVLWLAVAYAVWRRDQIPWLIVASVLLTFLLAGVGLG